MARFNIQPTVALALDRDGAVAEFVAYVPGPVVRSKFDEPMRLFTQLGRYSSREGAEAEIKKWRKS